MAQEASPGTTSLPANLTQLKRFFRTWENLLLHPADFFKVTVTDKKANCWPALGFLSSALLVASISASIIGLCLMWLIDPGQPMDLKALLIPSVHSDLITIVIGLGIESFLFYAILHGWLDRDWPRTTIGGAHWPSDRSRTHAAATT